MQTPCVRPRLTPWQLDNYAATPSLGSLNPTQMQRYLSIWETEFYSYTRSTIRNKQKNYVEFSRDMFDRIDKLLVADPETWKEHLLDEKPHQPLPHEERATHETFVVLTITLEKDCAEALLKQLNV